MNEHADSPRWPALFVSHGSPMIALEPGATGPFLSTLGDSLRRTFGTPRAVLAVSAHTLARVPTLLAAPRHEAVYDFGGFPPALSRLRYDAPGAPSLAPRAAECLSQAGFDAKVVDAGGLDHGIWTMLRYLMPQADVPVLPLAFDPHEPPEDAPEIAESSAFRAWFAERAAARDWEALAHYRTLAPHAVAMHPTDEHLLPWFVAAGAGGRDAPPRRLHDAVTYGALGMDVYGFGGL